MAEKALTRKRGTVKAKITVFYNFISQLQSRYNVPDNKMLQSEYLSLEMKVKNAAGLYDEFERLHDEIELNVEDSELPEQLKDREKTYNLYFDTMAIARSLLDIYNNSHNGEQGNAANLSCSLVSETADSGHNKNNSAQDLHSQISLRSVKLPMITLPKFDGDYESWLEFRDIFKSLIHDNTELVEVQKFHYLKACLVGNATHVIQSLKLSATNYEVAWQTLVDRYDNTNLLIQNHIKTLYNLESIPRESSSKIRDLVDNLTKNLRSLKSLDEPIEHWDTLLIFLVTSKLDSNTEQEWEKIKPNKVKPTLDELLEFLKRRADILETIEFNRVVKKSYPKNTHYKSFAVTTKTHQCSLCNAEHFLYTCDEFKKLSNAERLEKAKQLKVCINCLRPGHFNRACKYSSCKICHSRHNTLVHVDRVQNQMPDESLSSNALCTATHSCKQILLSTALIQVLDDSGNYKTCRVVLDSASQSNLITESFCAQLGVIKSKINLNVIGINQVSSRARYKCNIKFRACYGNYESTLACIILPKITDNIPNTTVNKLTLNIPKNIQLADPNFNKPGPIDVLIGAELFWHLICNDQIQTEKTKPILQKTRLGWIVTGPTCTQIFANKTLCNFNREADIQNQLAKFWEIENPPNYNKSLSVQKKECEFHFVNTFQRTLEGRFIVSLPFKDPIQKLGDFNQIAFKRFYSLVADSICELSKLGDEITQIMNSGGFELRKWVSNEPTVLIGIRQSSLLSNMVELGEEANSKTLGLLWSSNIDELHYKINSNYKVNGETKRTMLSTIAQIFDPLGLLAPLNQITIPRLELCGVVLLSQLITKVKESLTISFDQTYLWTDSTIVLGWIATQSHLLKPFVNHRITEIQENTNVKDWHHIATNDNPADMLSRGITPQKLKSKLLWWLGPSWLAKEEAHWPISFSEKFITKNELPELRKSTLSFVTVQNDFKLENYSNLTHAQRIVAWCFRFKINCVSAKNKRLSGPLTFKELQDSLSCLVKLVPGTSFFKELSHLNQNKPLSVKSKLLNLNPFLDSQGILRVGGRIEHSTFSFDKKHPILLPSTGHFTKLLFEQEHIRWLHAGSQQMLFSIRQRFWPIHGRNISKQTFHNCIKCVRQKANVITPIMGNLPAERLNPESVFHVVGVDYTGPMLIKDRLGKGSKISKCYICLFVCFAVKAIHIEVVSSLSSEAFLACFRRFIARRGKPRRVYSDNGTTFVGAYSALKELGKFLYQNKSELVNQIAKSMKMHLKRIVGTAALTFEELSTVLSQIESILNSRPLSPLSTDPNDLMPLTPGHFLLGRPLVDIPARNLQEVADNRLSRFQRLEKIKQNFWKRWSLEYVSELQTRTKWKTHQTQIKVGTLVLIKEDNAPPLSWNMGRVIQTHPGADGVIRVVSVKTIKGVVKRALAKICPLPLEDQERL